MKTQIITSLALLFALSTSGSVVALLTFGSATDLDRHVVKRHQIEDLRGQFLAELRSKRFIAAKVEDYRPVLDAVSRADIDKLFLRPREVALT